MIGKIEGRIIMSRTIPTVIIKTAATMTTKIGSFQSNRSVNENNASYYRLPVSAVSRFHITITM